MRLFFYLLVAFALLYTEVFAVEIKDFDTRGNDFWLAFPPNIHDGNKDSLYIYIGAEKPTKGTISFPGIPVTKFEIRNVNNLYTYAVSYSDFEIAPGSSETSTKIAFHIVTDSQVTVYALSKAEKTSDAFLVLPTNVLGLDYYVMSYNSHGIGNPATPSQFVVIATQDATKVAIALSSNRAPGTILKTRTVNLQKGESYLVRANSYTTDDLTGTHVTSNKPIAVLGSHQRAAIPYTSNQLNRDFLIEQMIPVNTWGYDAYLVPLPEPSTGTGNEFNNDIYRILAARDNTQIMYNGKLLTTLKAGQMYAGQLTEAASISANRPIMVALFKKSTEGQGGYISDPFMMLVPPADQFLKSYRWVNSQVYIKRRDWGGSEFIGKVYEEQYVIVVAPNSSISSIRLDGAVRNERFNTIPNSVYSYAAMKVSDGVHSIIANEGIGIYVLGYGPADSYGYIGGMNMVNTTSMTSSVKPLNISASPGETVNLPLILDSIKGKPNIEAIGIDHYTATLRFNATLLTPLVESQRGKIENGFQTIMITGGYSGQGNSDTLATIPMVAGLGDAESTPIDLIDFHWFGIAGDTITSTNGLKSAIFTLKDVFNHSKDGKRLINPQEGRISLSIEPNPTSSLPISIILGGEILPNSTLIIYNTIGRKVADLTSQLSTVPIGGSAPTYISFTQPNLSQGVYFVRLASGEFSIVRPLIYQ
ncbi:MAG: T9SS type A sorting domain-containing protein [Ignavibacteriae bacterium]|nr:T9SS type A sorting domain-containing protein [Ignavibacteriota bacterium]